jgi:DNA-binding transcriptional LysR family regulator
MTIDQLKYFLTVANNLSISHSAQKLHLSQSSISKHIQSLEKELSVKLFERNTRNIRLTEAGRYLNLRAAGILDEYEGMRTGINMYTPEYYKSISVTAIPVISHYGIPNMIARYSEENPYVDVKLSEMNPKPILSALDKKEIEIGIIRKQHIEASDYKYKSYPLIDDELVLVTNKEHRFAGRSVIDLSEAADERFVLLCEGTFMFKTCVQLCEAAGFFPNHKKMEIGLGTICSFVKQGLGVTLLMKRTVVNKPDPELCAIPLKQRPILTLSLVTRDEPMSPTCDDFIQFASVYFTEKNNLSAISLKRNIVNS